MHVVDTKRVELSIYEFKDVSRTLFDQLKEGKDKDASLASWACFEEAFLGRVFL